MKGPGQLPTGETLAFFNKVLELHVWTMQTEKGGYGVGWFQGADNIESGYGETITEARIDLDERMKGNYPSLFKEYPSTCQYQHCTNYRASKGMPYCHTHLKGLRDLERDLNKPEKKSKPLRRPPVQRYSEKQVDIKIKLHEVYELMDNHARGPGGMISCSAYSHLNDVNSIIDHSHTISQDRCKKLGKPELIYDIKNIEHCSREAHEEWDHYKPAFLKHRNCWSRMEYLSIHDPHDYDRRMLIWAAHNPTKETV